MHFIPPFSYLIICCPDNTVNAESNLEGYHIVRFYRKPRDLQRNLELVRQTHLLVVLRDGGPAYGIVTCRKDNNLLG